MGLPGFHGSPGLKVRQMLLPAVCPALCRVQHDGFVCGPGLPMNIWFARVFVLRGKRASRGSSSEQMDP